MTPGTELRTARERLSLSREQISSHTKIHVRKITALEEDAFNQLPTGIYLDGIAAAYARAVGLDADTFTRRLRTHVAPPPPETLEQIAAAREAATSRPREAGLSVAHSMVAFVSIAMVLAISGIGVRLYPARFLTEPKEPITETLAEREPAAGSEVGGPRPVAEPAPPSESASPEVVADLGLTPPLPLQAATLVDTPTTAPAHVRRPMAVADIVGGRAAIPQRTTPPAMAHQKATQSPPAASPQTQAASVRPRSTLTGVWTLETKVESSSLRAFEGLRLGYRLDLRQNGDRIEGTGQKVTENGIPLSGARRTAITLYGTSGDGRMRLTFGEQGALRRTTGTLDLTIDENGVLRGVFESEAARSAGAVEARRL